MRSAGTSNEIEVINSPLRGGSVAMAMGAGDGEARGKVRHTAFVLQEGLGKTMWMIFTISGWLSSFFGCFLYYLSAWEVLRSGTKFRFVGGSVIGPLQSTRVYMLSITKNNNGIQRTYPTGINIVVLVKYFSLGGYLKLRNIFEYPSC